MDGSLEPVMPCAMTVEIEELRDFLARHPPFDELPAAAVSALPQRLSMRYARRGTNVMAVGVDNHDVYVLRSGAIEIRDSGDALIERGAEGACFGSRTLAGGNPSRFTVTVIEDALLVVVPGAVWHELAGTYRAFRDFFLAQRVERLRGALVARHASESGRSILGTRARDMIRHRPVSTTGDVTIRDAARIMSQRNASSILVMDGRCILGIVTDRDLRRRVLAEGLDPGDVVSSVMTTGPTVVDGDASAFDVLMRMMDGDLHHVPVLEDGDPIGVVTGTDLVRLEHANPVYLVRDIGDQHDVEGIAGVRARLPDTVVRLLSQDATADDITKIVTAVGDAVTRRLVALAEAELGPPPAAYCWLALGSQARGEQVLGSDQDNAIVLADDAGEEGERYVAALAQRVVADLERCGYPRCPGDVMATNPRWRQRMSGWRTEFMSWMHEPEPEALLHAGIFFDARAVIGDTTLLTSLTTQVTRVAPTSERFLALMARHAINHEPPLGFFRGFVLHKSGDQAPALDLKWGGVGAIQELARVLALASGTAQVRTRNRLIAAASAGKLSQHSAENLCSAFDIISHVRMQHHAEAARAGLAPDNRIVPDELSTLDRRHLRDAFSVVRSAQQVLAQTFPLARW